MAATSAGRFVHGSPVYPRPALAQNSAYRPTLPLFFGGPRSAMTDSHWSGRFLVRCGRVSPLAAGCIGVVLVLLFAALFGVLGVGMLFEGGRASWLPGLLLLVVCAVVAWLAIMGARCLPMVPKARRAMRRRPPTTPRHLPGLRRSRPLPGSREYGAALEHFHGAVRRLCQPVPRSPATVDRIAGNESWRRARDL